AEQISKKLKKYKASTKEYNISFSSSKSESFNINSNLRNKDDKKI
ncbi:19527_t:CDS:1, partial [Racocetra fulgida]